MGSRVRWGAALLLVRPAYLLVEPVVAGATTGGYSFADDTISRLGAVGCDAAYCSPWHALMNGSFLAVGSVLAIAALLLAPRLGRPAAALLVVSGLAMAAVGLVPVDQDVELHRVLALTIFGSQPLALLALAWRFRDRTTLVRSLAATAVVTGLAALVFVPYDGHPGSGAIERLVVWPGLVALAVVGAHLLRDDTVRDRPAGTARAAVPEAMSGVGAP